jgi:hypothetical protein
MMKVYIGTKIVKAEPMDQGSFNVEFRGAKKPYHNDQEGGVRHGYKVVYEDGYVSWSPKETFERAYREVTIDEAVMFV